MRRPVVAFDLHEARVSGRAKGALYAPARHDEVEFARLTSPRCSTIPSGGAHGRPTTGSDSWSSMAWEYSAGELLRAYEPLCGPTTSA